MKTKLAIFTIIAIIFLIIYKVFFYQSFVEIMSNATISVGETVPAYNASVDEHTEFKHNKPSGKFYVYLIDSPANKNLTCLDLKCGKQAKIIRNLGGRLQGIRDGKHAKLEFGVYLYDHLKKPKSNLLVISNQKGVILKMYKNISIDDIPTIIKILIKQGFLLTLKKDNATLHQK